MFKRFRDDMKKYWKYAVYSSKAQLKSEIANSYLNWLWWVLDPLCFMLIYVFMFGYVFKSKEQYFAIFVFVGITLWDFFKTMIKPPRKLKIITLRHINYIMIPPFFQGFFTHSSRGTLILYIFHNFARMIFGTISKVCGAVKKRSGNVRKHVPGWFY